MNIRFWFFVSVILIVLFGITTACKKDKILKVTVTDIDGNVYHTVKIGTQIWMAENLKVKHYRNGDPLLSHDDGWNVTSGAYCDYYGLSKHITIYGILYNWYAINDNRKIAPEGWHIPTDEEWTILTDYLGGGDVAGGKLKEKGTAHWLEPNEGATNESCFNALPGGEVTNLGHLECLTEDCVWWSSTGWIRSVNFYTSKVYRGYFGGTWGFSVRCIKD